MRSMLLALSVALLLAGCVTPSTIRQPLSAHGETEHKFERNYEIGSQRTANVGEPMVRLRDYYIRTAPLTLMQADRDFVLKNFPLINYDISATTPVSLNGTVELEGVQYRVVTIEDPRASIFKFLVNADGTLEGRAMVGTAGQFNMKFKAVPADVKFHQTMTTTVATDKGGVNFELVYFGTTRDSFNIAYREFTPDDMARPAFTQNLVYSVQEKIIRFRDLLIDVESATNQSIRYTVIEDGLPK